MFPDSLGITQFGQCLKSISHIGSTTYMNVCNGATYSVPWGGADWILAVLGALLLVSLIALVATFIIMFRHDF